MIILGLHKDPWHNTGAAIIRDDGDGPQFAFVSEERLNRKKDSRKFPYGAIKACMRQLNIKSPKEFDLVVIDHIISDNWREDTVNNKPIELSFFKEIDDEKIVVINHHLAHACSTFYSSSYDSAAVLIVDGRGSQKETQTLFQASVAKNEIKLLEKTEALGIGLLYATMTEKIGFKILQEGKTMGLAPYGENAGRKLFNFTPEFDGIKTDYSSMMVDGKHELNEQFEGVQVNNFEDKAVASFDVQSECENAMLHLAKYAKEKTGEDYLCLSGGVALNSVSNYKIQQSGLYKDIFINPACSDTGIPLGCALYGYHIHMKQPKTYTEINPYLGPEYSQEDVDNAIEQFEGFDVSEGDVLAQAAQMLADNKIVSVHQGRCEMGPRALGNRSILMSPLKAENKDILNHRVKHREAFRPFAPAALEEHASEYFELDVPSPYMLFVPKVKADKRELLAAVTHVDGTGRLQTLTKERNNHFYNIVEAFSKITGVPVILNTSFNVAGEPIVETPADAIRCFLGTDIDALLIGNKLLIKTPVANNIEEKAPALVS